MKHGEISMRLGAGQPKGAKIGETGVTGTAN